MLRFIGSRMWKSVAFSIKFRLGLTNKAFAYLDHVYMKRDDSRIGLKNSSEINLSTCLHGESDLLGTSNVCINFTYQVIFKSNRVYMNQIGIIQADSFLNLKSILSTLWIDFSRSFRSVRSFNLLHVNTTWEV